MKTAPKKLALLQLANNADDDGKSWYSISKMAKACGVSDRTFQRQIKDLEQESLLIVERRANRPSIYTLTDHVGVTLTGGVTVSPWGDRESPPGVTESRTILTTDPNKDPNNLLCEEAFELFYSAGLVKKSRVSAMKKFKALVKELSADPFEFASLLCSDISKRISSQQFGIDRLHPSTYLNQQRWTDEHEQNNGNTPVNGGKPSAAERIAARNANKYGHTGG